METEMQNIECRELSDAELDVVSGGWGVFDIVEAVVLGAGGKAIAEKVAPLAV
jgi:hypothetical protein